MGFVRWIAAHPKRVLAAVMAATLLALAGIIDPWTGAVHLRVDPALNKMLPSDDAGRRFYQSLVRRFGSDDSLIVALGGDLFRRPALQAIVDLTDELAALPGVHHVDSLATALHLRAVAGDLEITGFLDELPRDAAGLRALRDEVVHDPLFGGSLVAKDGRTSVLIVTFDEMSEERFLALDLDRRVAALSAKRAQAAGLQVWVAGTPRVKAEISRILVRELAHMVPEVLVLMALLSAFFFRSWRGTLVPVITTVLAILWTLGIMAWTGHALNVVTTLIPPLVLAVAFTYAIHVVSAYQEGRGREDAVAGLGRVAFPVAFTAFTTAAGFFSLCLSHLGVIRGFGLYSTAGVACSLLAGLVVAPALLALGKGRSAPHTAAPLAGLETRFERLAAFDVRHRRGLLAIAAAVLLTSGLLALRIEVNTEVIGIFPADSPVRRSYEAINTRLGGANTFYIMLESNEERAFERPANLEALADLQRWLEAQPEIGTTTSMADYLRVIHQAFLGGSSAALRLPATRALARQLLVFGSNEELDKLVDPSRHTATILVRSTSTSSREFAHLAKRIDARLALLPAGIHGRATGNAILLTRASDTISRGQALSLAAACGMIGLILILYFRSLRVGLIALVPNLLPVAVYFGALGATRIGLNNSTALMASIVLGIAVDDTIHLLVHFRGAVAKHGQREAAVIEALRQLGRPVTYTTVVLCLGLGVVATSQLQTQADFGALGAFTLAVAWLADVTITPALCSVLPLEKSEAPQGGTA